MIFDNFHFLHHKTQTKIAIDVRSFSERNIKIILLSPWNFLEFVHAASPNLTGKIVDLSVEPWEKADLANVIRKGAHEYNVAFSEQIVKFFSNISIGNIGLLQNYCVDLLLKYELHVRPAERVHVDNWAWAQACEHAIARRLVAQVSAVLGKLMGIGEVWHDNHSRMAWILRGFLENSDRDHILKGMTFDELKRRTQALVGPQRVIPESTFAKLVKDVLMREQQGPGQSPVVGYNPLKDQIVILDSWFKLALKLKRQEILERAWAQSRREQ